MPKYTLPKVTKSKAKQFTTLISGVKNPELEQSEANSIWHSRSGHMRYDFWVDPGSPRHIYCQILHYNECIHACYYWFDTLEPDHKLTFDTRRNRA